VKPAAFKDNITEMLKLTCLYKGTTKGLKK